MLKRPLNTLLERWTQREERAARLRHQASHFLDSSSDDGEQTALGNEQNRGEGNAFFELLADERADLLKKSTLRHITEPDTFLHAALSKARERGCVEVPSGHVPARPVPSSSTRSSPRIKKSTSHTSSSTSSSSDVDRLLLSDLLSGHVCARDSYIIYPRLTTMQKAVPHVVEDSWEAKHYSYRWLLSLCHRLTYCSLSVVEKAVMEVEQRLIAHDFSQRMTEGVGESGNAEEVEADMSNRWQSTPKAPKHVHGISDSDCTVDRGGSTKRTGWSFGGKRSSGEDRRRGDEPASPSTRSAAKRRRSESTHVQTTLSVAEESATKKLKTQTNSSSSDVKRRKQASKQQDEDTRPDDNQSKSKKFARPTPTRPPDKRRLLPPRQTHSQQFSKDREITTDSDSSSGEEFMRTIRRRERLRHRQLRKHKAETLSPSARSAAKRRRSESTHVQTALSGAEESAAKRLKTQTDASSSDVKRRKQASKQQDEDTRPDDNQSKSKKSAHATPTRPLVKRRLPPPRQTHSQQFSKDREITTDSDSSSGEEFMRTVKRQERVRYTQRRKHKAKTLSA
ncbi:hypothetical protein BaRGS_00034457 [Batillaria attramentaria]|uniref:Uncharacterized protein n=1 Tax=Batillaria attramentaria TaxID=370345 RepID=A0ABD0JH65_9CAEN